MGAVVILLSAIVGSIGALFAYTLFGLGLPLSLTLAFGAGPAAGLFLLIATTINQFRPIQGSAAQSS